MQLKVLPFGQINTQPRKKFYLLFYFNLHTLPPCPQPCALSSDYYCLQDATIKLHNLRFIINSTSLLFAVVVVVVAVVLLLLGQHTKCLESHHAGELRASQ